MFCRTIRLLAQATLLAIAVVIGGYTVLALSRHAIGELDAVFVLQGCCVAVLLGGCPISLGSDLTSLLLAVPDEPTHSSQRWASPLRETRQAA